MKKWFEIKAQAEAQSAEITIFDDIGMWGVTARQFIAELKALDVTEIKLMINSLGGSLFDAIAMANALQAHPAKVSGKVMGVAASAATVVLMASDTIEMPENSFLMIHNPMSGIYGNADEMREWADTMDKFAASMISTYAARTGQTEAKVKELLDAETWLTAAEAKALGFADSITPAVSVTMTCERDRLPKAVLTALGEPKAETPAPTAPVEPASDADMPAELATMAAQHNLLPHVGVWLSDKTIRSKADAKAVIEEAKQIVTLCADAKQADLGALYINSRTPLAVVKQSLLGIKAANDQAIGIDNKISNQAHQTNSAPKSELRVSDVYAARKQKRA